MQRVARKTLGGQSTQETVHFTRNVWRVVGTTEVARKAQSSNLQSSISSVKWGGSGQKPEPLGNSGGVKSSEAGLDLQQNSIPPLPSCEIVSSRQVEYPLPQGGANTASTSSSYPLPRFRSRENCFEKRFHGSAQQQNKSTKLRFIIDADERILGTNY